MELRHLRYFVAVAEQLHFRHAAKIVNVTQPALSQQIRQLEKELGVVLLERSRHQVRLTPAGKVFYENALGVLRQVDLAAARKVDEDAGDPDRFISGDYPGARRGELQQVPAARLN